ncbi:MAG: hypothetical protein WA021_04885 [Minisyncoccia bacterium]
MHELKSEYGARDERVSQVRAKLIKLKEESAEYMEADVAVEFARESAHLSGKGKRHTGLTYIDLYETHVVEPNGSRKIYEIHTGKLGYADTLFRRHIELVNLVINGPVPEHSPSPSLINDALRGSDGEVWWRDGLRQGTWDFLPRPEYVEILMELWLEYEQEVVATYAQALEDQREAISWALYDLFIGIEPFSGANDRTARLLLQSVRRRIGLEPVLIRQMHGRYHEKRFVFFRDTIFVPLMRDYQFII